ncbi:MAG: ZIP family metal transporter [Erysipelotrichaceae bacterium]|nr:ZIP family metal transporter [Erysipelotrichaceae bacterium]
MNSINMAFLLTTLAGLSTMLGVIPIFIKLRDENQIITASLAFAAGVMICVSITDLIPESILMLENYYNGFITVLLVFLFLLIGIVVSSFIDKVFPTNPIVSNSHVSLYKVGIISMVAIILHNLPEGIATFISTTKDTSLGISLAVAIALHNIPEGISISVPIYYSTKSKIKAIFYTFISAMSEPLGAILTYLFLFPFINNVVLGLLFAFIAGIMIQISLTELIPTAQNYSYPKITKIFFIIGVIFMLVKFFI